MIQMISKQWYRFFFPLVCCICLLFFKPVLAQDHQFELWIDEPEQLSEHSFLFTVHLRNSGFQVFEIADYSFAVGYNPLLLNGGIFHPDHVTYIAGSSGFEAGSGRPNYPAWGSISIEDQGRGSLLFQSGLPAVGDRLTALQPGQAVVIGTFIACLRADEWPHYGHPQQLGCVWPGFFLVAGQCQVNTAVNTDNGEVPETLEIAAIDSKIIHDIDQPQQFAGYWYYGAGHWNTLANWNTLLTSENPNYTPSLPGIHNNVAVAGHLTIEQTQQPVLTPNESNGGQLTIIKHEPIFFSLKLEGNGESVSITLVDEFFNVIDDNYVIAEPNTIFHFLTFGNENSGTFINWTDQHGNVVSGDDYVGPYVMPAGNMVLTANWSTGVGVKHYARKDGTHAGLTSGLILVPGGSLTVEHLHNNHDCEDAVAALIIGSDEQGSGSLIQRNAGVEATFTHHIPGNPQGWRLIAAPIISANIAGSAYEPGEQEDFYLWDEQGTWLNYKSDGGPGGAGSFYDHNAGSAFLPGKGYLVAYKGDQPAKTLTGELFAGPLDITLQRNEDKSWEYEPGWNLLGNPYASSIDFHSLEVYGILEEYYAFVYDPNKDGGEGYVTVSAIAPGQGFFVRAASNQAELAISPENQSHGGVFLKQAETGPADRLVVRLAGNDGYDETTIALHPAGCFQHHAYNASKMYSFDESIPQLSSMTACGRRVMINSIPYLSCGLNVPLSIKTTSSKPLSLSLQQASGAFLDTDISLTDTKRDTIVSLQPGIDYSFAADPGTTDGRFLVGFTGSVNTPHELVAEELSVYAYRESIYIDNPQGKALVRVYSPAGSLVKKRLLGAGRKRLQIPGYRGAVVVAVTTDSQQISQAVFIH